VIHDSRRAKEAAEWRFPRTYANASWMRSFQAALSRHEAARRFKISVARAVRWVKTYLTTGEISPNPQAETVAPGGSKRIALISWA